MSRTDSESDGSGMEEMAEDNDLQNRLDDDTEFPISEEEDGEAEDDHEEEDSSADDEDVNGKSAWAESISKILSSKNTGVLSKAQTIADIEKKKMEKRKMTFEVVGDDEKKIKLEDIKPDQEQIDKIMRKRKRREQREVGR